MQSLFPQRSSSGNGLTDTKIFISFNCGKCDLTNKPNGKFLVTPESRKGKLSLEKDADGLTHVIWSERNSNAKDLDKIVFPDDVKFKKAKTGRENDRVYALYLHGEHYLFWMQDKSTEKDEENCKKLNEYANNPTAAEAALAAQVAAANTSRAASDAAEAPNDTQDWMQMMGLTGMPGLDATASATSSGASSAAAGASAAANPFATLDLSSLLSQFNNTGLANANPVVPSAVTSIAPVAPPATTTSTVNSASGGSDSHVLDSDLLNDPQVISQLLPHMPSAQRTEAALLTTLRSASYRTTFDSVESGTDANSNASVADGISNLSIQTARPDKVRAMIVALQRTFPSVSVTDQDSANRMDTES